MDIDFSSIKSIDKMKKAVDLRNFRYFENNDIGISLDETTSENDLIDILSIFNSKLSQNATSLGSAKQLLRTLHVVEFIEEMLDAGKSSTLREMYYISEGWGMGKFGSQNDSNNLAEDLEIVTKCLREDFKLRPEETRKSVDYNYRFCCYFITTKFWSTRGVCWINGN